MNYYQLILANSVSTFFNPFSLYIIWLIWNKMLCSKLFIMISCVKPFCNFVYERFYLSKVIIILILVFDVS